MKKYYFFFFMVLLTFKLQAQKEIRTFIFGNSLINHEFQNIPTLSQETSVPHWFHFLASESGHEYFVGGQYGFLPQHANLPPIAQWGFDFAEGVWDSDNEPFSAADVNNIIITPGNFIQWQGPEMPFPNKNLSPVSATVEIFNWCIEQEDNLKIYIYENWPDMASFLSGGFPPLLEEWLDYNSYLQGEFHEWFIDYHRQVKNNFSDQCINFIPVGSIISEILLSEPYDQIPIEELYEDDAPHGRASLYFLASLITYMTVVEEKAPSTYEVEEIIHPIIRNNYNDLVNQIWNKLRQIENEEDGEFIFCDSDEINTVSSFAEKNESKVYPNPSGETISIAQIRSAHTVQLFDLQGNLIQSLKFDQEILLDHLSSGSYLILVFDKNNQQIFRQLFIKQ